MQLKELQQFLQSKLIESKEHSAREAEQVVKIILFDGLAYQLTDLIMNPQLSEDQVKKATQILSEVLQGIPIQYCVQTAHFYGIELFVNSEVLIPRPETEELVEWILQSNYSSLLDIGTGSACIPCAIKHSKQLMQISAADISPSALEVAKKNASQNKLEIEFLLIDVLQHPEQLPKADIWVSNPPYIAQSEEENMPNIVTNHEPYLALFVEDHDPLVFYRVITTAAIQKGVKELYFELHEDLTSEYQELWKALEIPVTFKLDLQGKTRMAKLSLNS